MKLRFEIKSDASGYRWFLPGIMGSELASGPFGTEVECRKSITEFRHDLQTAIRYAETVSSVPLLPCPICGRDATIVEIPDFGFRVRCSHGSCCSIGPHGTEDAARDRWNTRGQDRDRDQEGDKE